MFRSQNRLSQSWPSQNRLGLSRRVKASTFALLASFFLLFAFSSVFVSSLRAQEEQPDRPAEEEPEINRSGRLLKVPLPLTGTAAAETIQQIRSVASQMPAAVAAEDRAIIVLEFDAEDESSGRGSDLGACISVAEFLVSPELKSVRTVAYIPAADRETALIGHAILAAVSCNEIAMDENASIGNAGVDLENVAPYVREVYRGIASQRLTLPVPMVLGMLDSSQALYRVTTNTQTVYVDETELPKIEPDAIETKTLSSKGEVTLLSSKQLSDFRLIANRSSSRTDLARRYNISPTLMNTAVDNQRQWQAIESVLPELLDSGSVSWLVRSIKQEFSGGADLVFLEFGDIRATEDAALDLAEFLVSLDSEKQRTIAYVSGDCKGFAGVAALCCDDVVFGSKGKLGLPDGDLPDPERLKTVQRFIKSIAEQKEKDWSVMMAVVNPRMAIRQYRSKESGAKRLMGQGELDELPADEAAKWVAGDKFDLSKGISIDQARDAGIASDTEAASRDVVFSMYPLKSPPNSLQPTATDRWIEEFAMFLTNPVVSMMLIFGAFICFMNELSAPGLGGFGFLGVLLLAAFFWSQNLEGNAEWFEILLFVIGVAFVIVEILVTPGFGLFGIGGIAMVLVSLILASQNFVLPSSDEDFAQLPKSLLPIFGAFAGIGVGAIVLRKVLPHAPFFRRLILDTPEKQDGIFGDEPDREAVADWSHLLEQKGTAVTRLMPSGKARIAGKVYDVITDGQVVQKGESVLVTEAVANRVVVKKI